MRGTDWGWRPRQPEGIWKHGCKWARPFTAAAPWITLALLLVEFAFIQGRISVAGGVVFNLPQQSGAETSVPGLAAIVMPMMRDGKSERETLVFFDDERYSLSDSVSLETFKARLSWCAMSDESGSLLLLADERVPSGDLMKLTAIAREAGLRHVQIGEKRK